MAEYKPDRAGLREFLRSNELYPELERVASTIQARAQSNARTRTGEFRDSIHTERHRSPSRVTARVVADSDGAAAIEARDRALGRAAG